MVSVYGGAGDMLCGAGWAALVKERPVPILKPTHFIFIGRDA